MLAYDYPLLGVFWTMLWFFLFFIWIWLLITIFADIFRSHDIGGFAKALWVIFVIVVPFLGVLIYLIAHGKGMQDRAARARRQPGTGVPWIRPRCRRRLGVGRSVSQTGRSEGARSRSPTPSSKPRKPRSCQLDGCWRSYSATDVPKPSQVFGCHVAGSFAVVGWVEGRRSVAPRPTRPMNATTSMATP